VPIETSTLITITQAEVDRVNALLDSLTTERNQLNGQVATLNAQIAQLLARIRELESTPPPTTLLPRIDIRNGRLVDIASQPFTLRGMELMCNDDVFNRGFVNVCADLAVSGCNGVSPLFQGKYGLPVHVEAFIKAAHAQQLVVGVNADHQNGAFSTWANVLSWVAEGFRFLLDGQVRTGSVSSQNVIVNGQTITSAALGRFNRTGRLWITEPKMVAICNRYPGIFLECEVETDPPNPTNEEWEASVKNLIDAYRTAGHEAIIKVGAPQGGRQVRYPLAKGAAVAAYDPKKRTAFTWQAYWKEAAVAGWHYQGDNGFAAGVAGTKQAIQACANSGLCFIVGFDWIDDVGLTGELALIAEADLRDVSCQHWVLYGDGMGNNLKEGWQLTTSTTMGTQVLAALKVKGVNRARLVA
jgi:hypothetical protein